MKDSLLEPGLAAGMDIHAVLGLQLFAAPRLAAQILFCVGNVSRQWSFC